MASLQSYGDGASTTLGGGGIDAVVTALTLAGPLGAEWPTAGQVDLNLSDTELVSGVISGTTVSSLTRGVKPYKGNTGGKVHAQGDSVRLVLTSSALKNLVTGHPFRAQAHNNADQGGVVTVTPTKVLLQVKDYDPNSNFDNAVNYRYTAVAAGYYQISGVVAWTLGAQTGRVIAMIYKNGAEVIGARGAQMISTNSIIVEQPTATITLFLAATDYIELYAYHAAAANATVKGTGNDNSMLSIQMIGQ